VPSSKFIKKSRNRSPEHFSELLLAWFDVHGRRFPWRRARNSAYRIALAEALLQKTNVEKALPVFSQLIRKYPKVSDLAKADLSELVTLLKPLGLPRRAVLLHQLGVTVQATYGGKFPRDEKQLRELPGVGPYGAGAIASQAFGQRATMVDINVMRIFHRVFGTPFTPRSGPSKEVRQLARDLMPAGNEADFNLALIDFGALVCRSKNPAHEKCPFSDFCQFYLSNRPAT
jgi:A/G-specific adenine glycosylase